MARVKKINTKTLKAGQVIEVKSSLPLPEPVTVSILKMPDDTGPGLAAMHLHEVWIGDYEFRIGSTGSLNLSPKDKTEVFA